MEAEQRQALIARGQELKEQLAHMENLLEQVRS